LGDGPLGPPGYAYAFGCIIEIALKEMFAVLILTCIEWRYPQRQTLCACSWLSWMLHLL